MSSHGQPPEGGRLAAGDDQPVDLMEFLRAAHRYRLAACRPERAQVLGDVALKGEHADTGFIVPPCLAQQQPKARRLGRRSLRGVNNAER